MSYVTESEPKGGLCVLDSMTPDEFQNVVNLFSLLLDLDEKQKMTQLDLNPEIVPLTDNLK